MQAATAHWHIHRKQQTMNQLLQNLFVCTGGRQALCSPVCVCVCAVCALEEMDRLSLCLQEVHAELWYRRTQWGGSSAWLTRHSRNRKRDYLPEGLFGCVRMCVFTRVCEHMHVSVALWVHACVWHPLPIRSTFPSLPAGSLEHHRPRLRRCMLSKRWTKQHDRVTTDVLNTWRVVHFQRGCYRAVRGEHFLPNLQNYMWFYSFIIWR